MNPDDLNNLYFYIFYCLNVMLVLLSMIFNFEFGLDLNLSHTSFNLIENYLINLNSKYIQVITKSIN
jgi:hypothetical protein